MYAVHRGRNTGVFTKWIDVKNSIDGFKGSKFKKFNTKKEAHFFAKFGYPLSEQQTLESFFEIGNSDSKCKVEINEYEIPNKNFNWDMEIFGRKCLIAFTDGSFKKIKKERKILSLAGIGIHYPQGQIEDIGLPFGIKPITNQRAELYAIFLAIKQLSKFYDENKVIKIYSDSEYSIKCVTQWIKTWKRNGWKTSKNEPVKNLDIIKPIDSMCQQYTVSFEHIRSHTNKQDKLSLANEKADKLAVFGRNKN